MPDPTKPRRTRFVDGDIELEAMAAARDALEGLADVGDGEVQDRVISWVLQRYAPTWHNELELARRDRHAERRIGDLVQAQVDRALAARADGQPIPAAGGPS